MTSLKTFAVKIIAKKLRNGKIGVVPTDTIYGIAASAWSKKAVRQAYKVLKRNPEKPFIILISSLKDLALFDIRIDNQTKKLLSMLWPGKISIILPVTSRKFQYLHRGTKTLAFRVPQKPSLAKLLEKTGPLISTSANPEGKKPAKTIAEARKYFGDKIDFYVSGGKIKSPTSTLIEIKNSKVHVLRKGAVKIPGILLN